MAEFFVGQLVALITFFAFPAVQYVLLKRAAHKDGNPELWYLPDYGFRLVIRNIPRNRTLSNIKYRALLRRIVPSSKGASVSTFEDRELLSRDDFFLFPGVDQVLISFRLEREADGIAFIHTDKMGAELSRFKLRDGYLLIADYSATIENWFNFDVQVAKRVELWFPDIAKIVAHVVGHNHEQRFEVSQVRNAS